MENPNESQFWIARLLKDFEEETIPKGEYFLKVGDKPNRIGYIQSGYFVVVSQVNAKNIIRDFLFENDFLGSYGSILTGESIQHDIIARESSKILVGNINRFLENHQDILEYLKSSKYFLEYVYTQKEEKDSDFLLLNLEEKYFRLKEKYKKNFHRIKKDDIASYLGITNSTFYRLTKLFE